MKGVMIPSVSAGSSQREASVMCTPQVMVPSGAAVAGRAMPRSRSVATNTTTTREGDGLMEVSSRCEWRRADHAAVTGARDGASELLRFGLVGSGATGAQLHEAAQQIEPERRAERGADGGQQPARQQGPVERLP